jgi:hypothetical protein
MQEKNFSRESWSLLNAEGEKMDWNYGKAPNSLS